MSEIDLKKVEVLVKAVKGMDCKDLAEQQALLATASAVIQQQVTVETLRAAIYKAFHQ